jgi:uncharacterized protein (TIGR04562 family)
MSFPWQALNVVFNGVSPLDIDHLELKSEAEAHQFILSYGFDLFESSHVSYLEKVYSETIDFIDAYLCTDEVKIPAPLRKLNVASELKSLLLLSSGLEQLPTGWNPEWRPWACAILRVIHVSLHLKSDLRLKYLPKIKRQTVDRFSAHVQEGAEGMFLGFESDKVKLARFEKKQAKVRDSVLLKLLHKPSAIAQEIHDHIGVRFVTEGRVDAVRVVQYLIAHHLLSFPNVMAARCRNTLIDLQEFKKVVESVPAEGLNEKTIDSVLSYPKLEDRQNQFSSERYRSLQFTTRQLIRIPVVRRGVKSEMTFFFPLEIQIMDLASYEESLTGKSGHAEYKQKQLEAVRQRVLKGLRLV